MPMLRRALHAVWLCASSALAAAALDAVPVTGASHVIDVWQTEDGLPQNSVVALTQTMDGYLWLGTPYGLVRFDGIRFTVFDESNTPDLPSSQIVHLFEDSQRNLWIGTEAAGVALVKEGRVRPLDIGRGSRAGRLMSACETSDGAVWLYTADGQLCRHRAGRVDVWNFEADRLSRCRVVIAEKAGPLWLGTDFLLATIEPVLGLDPRELSVRQTRPAARLDFLLASGRGGFWRIGDGRIQKWNANRLERDLGPYPWRSVPVSSACEDREGNLLVGTLGAGVYWFDADGKATCFSTNQGLSHDWVLSLQVDREGNLWVGTDGGGLNRVKRQAVELLAPTQGMVVQSVCEDTDGGLWMGSNADGIAHWSAGVFKRFGLEEGLSNLFVRSVFVDRQQRVLAGTWGSGLFQHEQGRFRNVSGFSAMHPVVQAIHQDRRGQLWLGTEGGLMRVDERGGKVFTTRDGLSSDLVQAIADDSAGDLWIGTRGGGLNRLREGKFSAFTRADGLPGNDISSLWLDAEDVLWIGTRSSGLARFREGKWTRYSTREGLVSNSVGYLIEDGEGNMWIGSTAGLTRVPKKALNDFAHGLTNFIPCRTYSKPDGLPTGECTSGSQPGPCRTRDGRLWFPTIKGLVTVNPAQLRPNTNPPPVIIEAILVEGESPDTRGLRIPPQGEVKMHAGQERLEIQYTSLNLGAPERARFRYRLSGHETAWIEAGDARVARYSKLPPGDYQFQVTACNEDGVWNDSGASLALKVEPPFWRTWWFLTGAAAGLLGAIVGTVHYFSTQKLQRQVEQLRQQEALEHERARIARDIHDQLGASLTQMALLGELVESDKNSPTDIESHARQISQAARDTTRTLDEIVWTVNPSNDTLEGLVNYICKYAQEYLAVAGLRYRMDAPPQLPGAPIPPEVRHNVFLASKEALTNIVRHAQATAAWIRLQVEPNRVILEIADDGRGLAGRDEGRAASRNGLRNMRRRMEDIGGGFELGSAPEGGTLVRLTIPIQSSRGNYVHQSFHR